LGSSRSVGRDSVTLLLDTAAAITIFNTDLDVAAVAPSGSPGVLDKVVFLAALSTVADSEDSMIHVGTAARANNTSAVVLEDRFVSLKGDSDGTLRNGTLESRRGTFCDSAVAANLDLTFRGAVFAGTLFTDVWVGRFSFHGVSLGIFEGAALVTTIATVAVGVAVNELLLGERKKGASSLFVSTFHGTS